MIRGYFNKRRRNLILLLGVSFMGLRQFRADFRAAIGYQPKNIFFQGQPIIVVCCYSPLKWMGNVQYFLIE
jgi:hypothetical protein